MLDLLHHLPGLVFGAAVGTTLGLTGGGGSLLAVPLLIYGLGLDAQQAILVSLVSVGSAALMGTIRSIKKSLVVLRSGLYYMIFGMLGAPVGAWLAQKVSSEFLTILFAFLMIFVSFMMWKKSNARKKDQSAQLGSLRMIDREEYKEERSPSLLPFMGTFSGVFTGLFGVGGGFIIVPSLNLVFKMELRKSIATSLFIISGITVSGVFSSVKFGVDFPLMLTCVFTLGSVSGILFGQSMSSRISIVKLQRIVAVVILLLACFVLLRQSLVL